MLPESSYTRAATLAGKPLTGLVDARKALALFDDGATIVFQGLHRYWPPLTRLVAELELELGHPCQANAYLTPPGAQGFAVHSDSHDVFVFQTAGAKQWEVHTPDGVEDLTLEPGLSVYLPTGTPHAARAQDTVSLHVTLGINQLTWRGLVRRSIADRPRRGARRRTCRPATSTTRPRSPTGSRPTGSRLADADPRRRRHATRSTRRYAASSPAAARGWPAASSTPPGVASLDDTHAAAPPSRAPLRAARRTATGSRCCSATARSTYPPASSPALDEIRPRPELRPADLADAPRPAEPAGALPPPGARGPPGDRTGDPARSGAGFRCSGASVLRDEPIAGTASNVRAFLLVEHTGAWGLNALRDARLPDGLGNHLLRSSHAAGVRVLLARRPDRSGTDDVRVFAAYADPVAPWLESAAFTDIHEVLDLDLAALGRGGSLGLEPTDGSLFCVCTHGRHDACCAERGRPVAAALEAAHPEETWEVSHIGGDRFAANLVVLPHGLYYGRLDAAAALGVAGTPPRRRTRPRPPAGPLRAEHAGPGGRDRAAPPAAARPATTPSGSSTRARADDVTTARFDVAGTTYAVRVRTRAGRAGATDLPGDSGTTRCRSTSYSTSRRTRRIEGWRSPTMSRS